MDYEICRVFERSTVEDYVSLFRAAYGQQNKLTGSYLSWLYLKNPHGRVVGFDAYLNGELAAHYATVPRLYRLDGEDVPAVLSVNTATHPDHQRRRLFSQLAEATYSWAAKEGYKFVLGVANAQSIHGFVSKLGFVHLGQVGLALGRVPMPPPPDHAHLTLSASWLEWRMSNPASTYFITEAGQDRATVNTRRGRAVFSLGSVCRSILPDNLEVASKRRFRGIATLAPIFPKRGIGPFLPQKLMPSPWHVIFRPLASDMRLTPRVHLDGLAMDTF